MEDLRIATYNYCDQYSIVVYLMYIHKPEGLDSYVQKICNYTKI